MCTGAFLSLHPMICASHHVCYVILPHEQYCNVSACLHTLRLNRISVIHEPSRALVIQVLLCRAHKDCVLLTLEHAALTLPADPLQFCDSSPCTCVSGYPGTTHPISMHHSAGCKYQLMQLQGSEVCSLTE